MEELTDSGSDAEVVTDGHSTDTREHQENIEPGRSQGDCQLSSSPCLHQNNPVLMDSTVSKTAPNTANRKTWTSSNAFINYLQDFRNKMKERPGKISGKKFLKLAGEQWRLMTPEEKQPYIEAAAWVKKQNLANPKKVRGRKRKRSNDEINLKKDIITAKRLNKKKKKSKAGKKKVIKKQKMIRDASESESASESEADSQESSDNESVTSEISL